MKQLFKHSLPTQKIVLRQDAGSDNEFLESNVGQLYPLIRIKEQTIDFASIVSFSLNAGQSSFLPVVTLTFDDSDKKFKESNFIEKDDIITIYVGNAKDTQHEVIKNDYLVMNVVSIPNGDLISIEALLHVPLLYLSPNRSFNSSSLEALQSIAKECGLGFVTNIDSTADSMHWIQYQATIDFVKFLERNSRISIDTKMIVFIDQFANLNAIDLRASLVSVADTMLTTEPITGKVLNPAVKLVASNNVQGNDTVKAIINTWSPITDFGEQSRLWPTLTKTVTFDISDNNTERAADPPTIHKQLRGPSTWSHFESDNTYDTYTASKILNLSNSQLVQGIKLAIELDYFIPVIYLMMSLPIEIWNIAKIPERWSQSETVDNSALQDVVPQQPRMTYELNKRLTGETLLQDMSISYIRKSTDSTDSKHLVQMLYVFLKKQDITE